MTPAAREWLAKRDWVDAYRVKVEAWFKNDVFPWVGARAIGELSAPDFLKVARRIEARGAIESAHRILQNCGQVMRYGIATGRAERNPVADLRGALAPSPERHHAAITDPVAVGGLLRAIDGYQGTFVTRSGLKLAPLVFVRPGELRQAEWAEFDLANRDWNIPGEKMKTGVPHLVPLSSQAIDILREIQPLTGRHRFVFPSARDPRRPMSSNAVLSTLRRMGVENDVMSGHGFRAMARTILDEVLQFRPDFIEHQLAHAVRDPNGRAYNRTAHLPERRKMMQAWADYLDRLKADTPVVAACLRTPCDSWAATGSNVGFPSSRSTSRVEMKPFYSVDGLEGMFDLWGPREVADALRASGVPLIHAGKEADLSGWWSNAPKRDSSGAIRVIRGVVR